MPNYSDWEPRQPDIIDLQLDPLNPRLPALGTDPVERLMIEELLRHEDVFDLAKDIGSQGYFPNESLVAIEVKGDLVIVEGNRRLASLKLLTSPELAPLSDQKRFASLSAKYKSNIPEKISVVVAPSRKATIPLIMSRHTRTGVKGWEPLQQAHFVRSLLDEGVALDDLPGLTGIPRADILNNLRTHSLYEMAKRLPLEEAVRKTVADPRKFSASILERVSGSPAFRSFLGIDFDEKGGFVGSIEPSEFQKAFSHVVMAIARKEIDTRTLNDAKSTRDYIKRLGKVKPDLNKKGSFTSDNFLNAEAKPVSVGALSRQGQLRRKKKAQPYLIARGFHCNLKLQRIKEIVQELQHLKVEQYENAVGVLLRILIELSISNYMDKSGQMSVLIAHINKGSKQQKAADWTPTLRQMLGYLMAKDSNLTQAVPRQAIKAINKAIADDDFPLSLDGMDQFVHNPYIAPSERQLRQFWNAFEPLVEYMMEEPTQQGSGRP